MSDAGGSGWWSAPVVNASGHSRFDAKVGVLGGEDSVGGDVFTGSQAESPNVAHSASIIP
ncbi:hypothetical protein [Arthrobacter bambusae]|uniref:hypothetical protein n=1 Tax=Arthrobacter bambusae TaxID=1338426 RepID=UPI0027D7E3DA|nr:hypothetical protein [Arthrobacter bambusae]